MNNEEPKKEDGIKSPFVPEVQESFDYDKYQDETTIKALRLLLKFLGDNGDKVFFNHDEKKEVVIENYDNLAQEMLNIMIDANVPTIDLQKVSDELSNAPYQLFKIISRLRNEYEKELLARTIGTRDPGNGKYSSEYATIGDMFKALMKTREEQGNNSDDYFFVDKKDK